MPGGLSGVSRLAARWLNPALVDGETTDEIIANPFHAERFDDPLSPVRFRQRSVALNVENRSEDARVVYRVNGEFHRVTARAVVVATNAHSAKHLVKGMPEVSAEAHAAWDKLVQGPVLVANVELASAAPLTNLGLGYDQYWWGSQYWADFVDNGWVTPQRHDPTRAVTLEVIGGNTFPAEEMANERRKLLSTPFCVYEDSLRADLNRVLGAGGFEFDHDVRSVHLYRWGHGMIFPSVGVPFGPPIGRTGQVVRTVAPRHIARQQVGRVSFAGQDVGSTPAIESAIGSAVRVAQEVLSIGVV